MSTDRELLELAAKAAAELCAPENLLFHPEDWQLRCHLAEGIESLDPAAIVASVPEAPGVAVGPGVSSGGKEQVEPTDASLLELAAKHGMPVITKAGHYPWAYIDPVLDFARALLSANQGK